MDDAATYLVIAPDGGLTAYRADQENAVETLVGGEYGPAATDTAWVAPPLRLMAADLQSPEHYPANLVASRLFTLLSGKPPPFSGGTARGHIALFEMEQDSGSIGEWLWPMPMTAELRRQVEQAHHDARHTANS